jgi:hypothetical protein
VEKPQPPGCSDFSRGMVAEMNRDNNIEIDSETSRIRAVLVNSGLHSFAEAEEKLAASALSLVIGDDVAHTPAGQAAFLTAAVTGARCFGQVTFRGAIDVPLLFPLPVPAKTLAEAATAFGAQPTEALPTARKILIGSVPKAHDGWAVRVVWAGWTAGIAPEKNPVSLGRSDCSLAGVAAGALAVGQAFLAEQGDIRAGRTAQSLSLWLPDSGEQGAFDPGPDFKNVLLPASLWLVGLGNLGQAFLWSLTLLPYPQPEEVLLLFQDDQLIGKENWGTSVLVERGRYGMLKTRIAEDWAMRRGFQVRRVDRRLDANLFRTPIEPGIALAGLDRMPARRLLGGRGFEYVIDAGLGATVTDYRKFRLNVFDSAANPSTHFADVEDETVQVIHDLMQLPSYRQLAESRGDGGCGAATLAGSSVAVPFVSAFVGALSITQAIRIASGEAHHVGITGDTGNLRNVRAAPGIASARVAVNSVRTVS